MAMVQERITSPTTLSVHFSHRLAAELAITSP